MQLPIHSAMILAAGLGTRMGALTKDRPKALIEVGGQSLIDRLLDQLAQSDVTTAIINVHHHADLAQAHFANRLKTRPTPAIRISDEREHLLETGGGLVKALPLLPKDKPFYVINSDIFLQNANAFSTLSNAWCNTNMDCLLLLIPRERATGHGYAGDFFMEESGRLIRRGNASHAPYVFSGIRIIHPRLAQGHTITPFSFNTFFDEALKQGRLFGVVYHGQWTDVGTTQALQSLSQTLQSVKP